MPRHARGVDLSPVEITAGRLHLRPWEPRDAPAVAAACADPEIARWTSVPAPYTAQDARAWVEEVSPRLWATGEGAPFAVLDAVDSRLLGAVGLQGFTPGAAEIGYWCAPGERGRGIMTGAVGAVCRWGFGALGLARVTWLAHVGNDASRRVAEKAGFRVEGTLRSYREHKGERRDALIGGLLATD